MKERVENRMWSLINSVFGLVSDAPPILFISPQDSAGLLAEGGCICSTVRCSQVASSLLMQRITCIVLIVTSES